MVLSLTFAIVEGPQKGWSSTLVTGLFAGTCTLLALFVMIERRRSRPMLDLTLFRYGRFIGAQMLPIGTAFAFVVPLVLLPTRFVGIHGMSAADAGAMMLPLCAPMVIVPFLGALLSRHVSSGLLSGIGLTVAAAGLLWIALLPESAAVGQLVWPMLTIGVGSGLPWGLMDDLAVSVVPKERAGMATGVFSTMRLTGEAIALASATALLVGLMQGQLREELATRAAGMSQSTSTDAQVAATANMLASGTLESTSTRSGPLGRTVLVAIYVHAFTRMSAILAAIAAVCATTAFVTLCPTRRHHTLSAQAHLPIQHPDEAVIGKVATPAPDCRSNNRR